MQKTRGTWIFLSDRIDQKQFKDHRLSWNDVKKTCARLRSVYLQDFQSPIYAIAQGDCQILQMHTTVHDLIIIITIFSKFYLDWLTIDKNRRVLNKLAFDIIRVPYFPIFRYFVCDFPHVLNVCSRISHRVSPILSRVLN